ncbi:MAG: MATE family efflux transporter [Rikenellaceae bacterium]
MREESLHIKRSPYLINKAFSGFLVAAILATASSNLAVIIDGIIVGRLLGASQLAAINLTMPLMQFIFTLVLLVSVGSSMLAARAIGGGRASVANHYFSGALLLGAALGIVLIGVGAVATDTVSSVLCSEEGLRPLVGAYLKPILLFAPIYLLLPILCTMMRIDGAAKLTATAMIVANVVNISFDFILISGLGMGIEGSSLATTIGNAVGIAVVLSHFIRKRNSIRFVRPRLKEIDIKKSTVLGLPMAIVSALLTVKLIIVNSIILDLEGAQGASYLAVSMSLMMLVSLFVGGVVQTIQPIGSMLLGQKDSGGLRLLISKAIGVLVLCVALIVGVIEAVPALFAQFFGITSTEVIGDAVVAIRLVTLSFLPFAVNYLLIVIYQLSGRSTLSIATSITQPMLVVVVMLIVSAVAPELVWWSFIISEMAVLTALYLISVVKSSGKVRLDRLTMLERTKESHSLDFSVEVSAPGAVATALGELDRFFEEEGCNPISANKIRLSAEELLLNIIAHGFKDTKRHFVDLRTHITDECITLTLKDDGRAFNPALEAASDKGLGLKIVQGVTPNIEYKYIFFQNTTKITIENN